MFSRMFGKRAAAIATSLAVVVGLIVSPAFAATASEGDDPAVVETTPVAELVEAPPAAPPIAPPADPPAEPTVTRPETPAAPAPAAVETSDEGTSDEGTSDEGTDDSFETAGEPESGNALAPQAMQRGMATMGTQSLGIQSTGITPTSLPSEFLLGQELDVQFGGVAADRWSMNWDFLSDANLSDSGHLSGYFSRPGNHTLTVKAEKRVLFWYETIESKQYNFKVVPAVLTESLPDATVGSYYRQQVDGTLIDGLLSSNTFSLVGGSLHEDLSLSPSGVISGTITSIPENPKTYTFDVRLRVANLVSGIHYSAPKTLSITVGYPAPTWNAITLPDATVGVAYPATSVSANGNGWAVGTYTATGLPDGLTLSSDGVITGTPLPNAAYSAIETVSVAFTADNGKTSTTTAGLVVKSPPSFVTTSPLPNAVVGTAYTATIATAGPDVTYELVSGPAGMVIDPATGELSGWTPTLEKNVRAEVKISNAAGESTQTFVIKPFAVPVITTTTLLSGIVGDSYSDQITFDGRNAKIKRVAGKLPNGLTLAKGTAANGGGLISGTPTTPGAFTFTVEVTNASGTVTQNFEIRVHDVPVIHVTKLSRAIVGQFYADTVVFSGFDAQVTIVKDALPGGLTLGTDGTITGATTDTGVTAFTVRVSNPAGSVQHRYRIVSFDVPMFQTTALDHGIVGKAFSQQLVADGHNVRFVVPKKFSLPAGMTLERDGLLHGTPTAAGDYTFNIRALNYAGTTVQSFTLTVTKPAMTLSTNSILRGGTLTVTGTGYVPGDNLELWLHSTPVLLGTTVAAGGTFTKTVTIPASTPAGAHSLVVVGAESGTTTSPVTVRMPAPTPSSTAPQGDPVDDSTDGTSDDSTDGTDELAGGSDETTPDEADEELPTLDQPEAAEETAPVAGAFNWGIIAALGALLLAVLLLLAILWRRRRAAEG